MLASLDFKHLDWRVRRSSRVADTITRSRTGGGRGSRCRCRSCLTLVSPTRELDLCSHAALWRVAWTGRADVIRIPAPRGTGKILSCWLRRQNRRPCSWHGATRLTALSAPLHQRGSSITWRSSTEDGSRQPQRRHASWTSCSAIRPEGGAVGGAAPSLGEGRENIRAPDSTNKCLQLCRTSNADGALCWPLCEVHTTASSWDTDSSPLLTTY